MTNPPVQRFGIFAFLIPMTGIYYLLNAQRLLGHYDLGWHLAAGDLIRQLGHLPSRDPWSFTSAGQPWFNLSWLWDACASVLFQYAGFGGLVLLVLACGAAIAGYLAHLGLRHGASALAVCIAVFAACVLYPSFATFPDMYLAASPNMFTMLFAVIFYAQCLNRDRRAILLLPAIMLLWANLHGGFLIGLFIVGFFGGMALLRKDWADFKSYGLAAAGCFAVTFINPLGWHIYQGVAATLGNFAQTYISEWWPYYRDMELPGCIPAIAYMLAFAGLDLRYRAACPLEARLLSWLFLGLGLYQFRYMAFFFLFSTVPLALDLDRLLPGLAGRKVDRALRIAGATAALALPFAYLYEKPAFGLPEMISERDVGYLETHFPNARLLNHWNFGGLLIFRSHGRVPVFVDGRSSTAYPEAVLRDYFPLAQYRVDEAAWDRALGKYRIDAVLWVKTHQEVKRFLIGKRGWTLAYTGAFANLYVSPRAKFPRPQ